MFSSAVVRGSRLKFWNTNPIFRLRSSARSSRSMPDTSRPSRKYWPPVGRSSRPRMFMSVDFPEPEAPTIATIEPFEISRLTPRSACTVTSPRAYERFRSTMRISDSATAASALAALELGIEGIARGRRARARPRAASRARDLGARDDDGAFREAVLDLDELPIRDADAHLDGLGLADFVQHEHRARATASPSSGGPPRPAGSVGASLAAPSLTTLSASRPARSARSAGSALASHGRAGNRAALA